MSGSKVIDQVLLQDYLDNLSSAVVQKMLDMYIEQSDIYLTDIQAAIENNSQDLWQQHTHKMKGAAGSVGMTKVHACLISMEKSTDHHEEKQGYLAELKQLNNEGIETFKQWLATA